MAIKTVFTAAIVIALFIIAGEYILGIFHISLAALKIAGGLILLLFALGMVMGEDKKPEAAKTKPSPGIAIYPLAMQLDRELAEEAAADAPPARDIELQLHDMQQTLQGSKLGGDRGNG